ncbi:BRO family protein [Methylococcus sp. EFPC2]|uniref:BRO family protein n=1 Tax=Methylococcus sp. EFPC2 TaxID=2812648 RepID=UPI0019686912|nr:BRO family protein [Methylococcus sp. EFPC2]QSA98122.1 antA/AntB antirepressor family protein [Methylococcus sp. EFPC2]
MNAQQNKRQNRAEAIECLVVHEADGQTGPFEQWVVASELCRFLALDRDFPVWIEDAINEGGFQQGRDFIPVPDESMETSADYHLGLDMALFVALNQYSGHGQQAARYIDARRRRYETTRRTTLIAKEDSMKRSIVQGVVESEKDRRSNGDVQSPTDDKHDDQGEPRTGALQSAAQAITLDFGGRPLRVVMREGEPWFVAKDVCDALELANSRMAIQALDDDERGVSSTYTPSRNQHGELENQEQAVNIVSESGFYVLALRCRNAMKPGTTAYRFRKWVTREVLPAIHRQGRCEAKPEAATGPAESPWLYVGSPDNLDLKVPRMPYVEGGYVFLLELSTGGVMLCASNEPGVNAHNIGRKLAEFEVGIVEVAVTRPHPQYLLLKNRIRQALSDLPAHRSTYTGLDIPTVQLRAEPVLADAFAGRVKILGSAGSKEAKLDDMLDEASRLLDRLRNAVDGPAP